MWMNMDVIIGLVAAIGGVLSVLLWGCITYLFIQCIQRDLVGAIVRYLDRR
jgi:hypothetical protein